MERLLGKVALITGAAHGIGAAIAESFAREGAVTWLTDTEDATGKEMTAVIGARAKYRHLDVREEEDWQSVIDEVLDTDGQLDVLVNNAGVSGFETGTAAQDPENTTLEDWRAVHRTNLDGVFLGCRHGIRAMRKTGTGSIVNISSRSAMVGIPAAAAYASSKAAVRNHTKSVALYCAEQNLSVRCNSILPGAILTRMWEPLFGTGPDRQQRISTYANEAPLKRFGRPDEIAAVAVLLASDEAEYITGTEIIIDGGILAGSIETKPK